MASSISGDTETQMRSDSGAKRGGWITIPFILGTSSCLTIAFRGWLLNLIVYLIEEFNVKSITATQVQNIVYGLTYMLPLIAGVLADSFFGNFSIISVSSFISLLGIVLLTLTAALGSLRPRPCNTGSIQCEAPSKLQYRVLYTALTLATVGSGGIRFTLATAGANQFDKIGDQGVFFNWFFFVAFASSVITGTATVYVEENVSWRAGFGLCIAANFAGCLVFLLGKRFYRQDRSQGSPFTSLARVFIASFRKRKAVLQLNDKVYYQELNRTAKIATATPSKKLRFLNRAALKTEGDLKPDGSVGKPWRLCSVQQVEDLKALVGILPLWLAIMFLNTPIAIQLSLIVLQALAMDRSIGPNFNIPAGSMAVIIMLSTCVFLPLIDRFMLPLYKKLSRKSLTPLQRVGIGNVFTTLSMAVSAVVESKRLRIAQDHPGPVIPMSVLVLFPQLIIAGIGDTFHLPGNVAFCYQEFPVALRSTATSMTSLVTGIAFYVSTGLINLIQNVTEWLPDDINSGRVDNVYWLLTIVGALNSVYFLVCASLYRYRHVEEEPTDAR